MEGNRRTPSRSPASPVRSRPDTRLTEQTTQPQVRLEVATSNIVVVFNLGQPFSITSPNSNSDTSTKSDTFVAGLYDTYVTVKSEIFTSCIQMNFTPIGAGVFFGVPMHLLSNRSIEMTDILGAPLRDVIDRMHNTASWARRFDDLERFIIARMADVRSPIAGTTWAYERIGAARGAIDIGDITRELGWSRKRLVQQFHEEIGLPPKKFARILRFQGVIRSLDGQSTADWADLAQQHGYYDQPHFNREFREFSGTTPTDYIRRRLAKDPGTPTV